MFGISLPELAIIFFVLLIAVGPERLPELARKVGYWSSLFKRNADAVRREFYNSVYEPAHDIRRQLGHELKAVSQATQQEERNLSPNSTASEPEKNTGDTEKKI